MLKNQIYLLCKTFIPVMSLSSYRMHRIYIAATMNYGLGSDDPEELAYFNKIRNNIDDMKNEPVKKGVPFN